MKEQKNERKNQSKKKLNTELTTERTSRNKIRNIQITKEQTNQKDCKKHKQNTKTERPKENTTNYEIKSIQRQDLISIEHILCICTSCNIK